MSNDKVKAANTDLEGTCASPDNNNVTSSSSISPQLDGHQTNSGRPLEAMQGSFTDGRQLEDEELSSRPSKVQVVSRPDVVQPSPDLQLSSRNSDPTPAPPVDRDRVIRNAVYDPRYEAMGLPVDPHLRMFLAFKQNKGGARGGSSTGNGNNNP